MLGFDEYMNKKEGKGNADAVFIFEWDAEDQSGDIIGIIRDVRLLGYDKKPIPRSSLVMEELGSMGWDAFLDNRWNGFNGGVGTTYALNVSGKYRWAGRYYAHQDYYGEWDCGWECDSLEPADRKTRKAVAAYGPGWDELPKV